MSNIDIHSGPLGEVRGAGASGGVSLSTTAAFTSFPTGTTYLTLMPRNASTAVVVRYAINPYLTVIKTTDALVAAGNLTDGSEDVQDGNTATNLNIDSLNTAANNDFIYVGSWTQFRGVNVDVGNINGTSSILTVKYRKNDDSWADISDTDGTASGGATFAQDGTVSWTVPSDWHARPLSSLGQNGIGDSALAAPAFLVRSLYWTRWEVSVALDSSVTLLNMQSMNRSTAYAELDVSLGKELRVHKGFDGTGNIEALTDAGTANLIIECATIGVGSKFLT
jgi:hypothetical protein